MRSGWLIETLLRLYPAPFRARYGASMRAFHEERVRAGVSVWQWLRIIADHVRSALLERARSRALARRNKASRLSWLNAGQALRSVRRRPLFAMVVIGTVALGVGVNTAIFSVMHGVVLRALPYPDAAQVVSFGHEPPAWLTSEPEFLDYQSGLRSFASFAAFTQNEGNLATEDEPERLHTATVSLEFFDVLGIEPLLGRRFAAEEALTAPAEVVIVSHGLWQRRFAGDEHIVGRSVMLNGRPRTVVGVMPPNFDYPQERTDIWLPLRRFRTDSLGDRANHYLFVVGRLRAGVPAEHAQVEARTLARRMMAENGERYDPQNPLVPVITRVGDALLRDTRPYLWALFGAVGFVVLIVCANIANLLLARGEGRRKELALRGALGATRSHLLAQMVIESLLLAVIGGVIGVGIAWGAQRVLIALSPPTIPRLDEIALNGLVLSYSLGLSLLAGLLFGVIPALRASRAVPAEMLKFGGRSEAHGSSRRVRQALVIAEVALAVTMLTGAGMLLRSLINLQSAPLGFDTSSTLTAKVPLTPGSYDDARATAFFRELVTRVSALPGVRAVGAAAWLPVVEEGGLWGVLAEGQSYDRIAQGATAEPQQVTPGYFAAMGMPVRGRDFNDFDRASSPLVGIVSESMGRLLWADEDPIGKRFRLGGADKLVTVIGVVDDIRARGFHEQPAPTMYFPYAQTGVSAYFMPRRMSLVIRTDNDPLAHATAVREIVRALDPSTPVSRILTLEQVVGSSVAGRRFSTLLIATFALIALLLAGMGIFGVVTYGVSQRTYEIGVRLALGAERNNILSMVVADSARMTLIGVVLGLIGAAAVARAIRSLLVDVPLVDGPTLGVVCVALTAVVVLATLLPARRATAVDPTHALRSG